MSFLKHLPYLVHYLINLNAREVASCKFIGTYLNVILTQSLLDLSLVCFI